MLRKTKNYLVWPWWSLPLTLAAVALIGSQFSPIIYDFCYKGEYTNTKECSAYHIPLFLFFHIGKFLEDTNGAIVAIATAFLAYITWRLVSLGREQADTTRAQLRAYVFIDSDVFIFPKGQKKAHINMLIKNFGLTPCKNGVIRVNDAICSTKETSFVFSLDSETAGIHSNITVAPGHLQTVTIDRTIEVFGKWESLRQENKTAYVWGRLDYVDVFGVPHFTAFQMYCPFHGSTSFANSENGNETN